MLRPETVCSQASQESAEHTATHCNTLQQCAALFAPKHLKSQHNVRCNATLPLTFENAPKLTLLTLLSLPSLLALYGITLALSFGNVSQLRDKIKKSLIHETNAHIARDSIH